ILIYGLYVAQRNNVKEFSDGASNDQTVNNGAAIEQFIQNALLLRARRRPLVVVGPNAHLFLHHLLLEPRLAIGRTPHITGPPNGGERKVNQPKPARAISTPRIRGRKSDLKMR